MEADDSILEHTKARLPWLVLALEVLSPKVLGLFEALCLSMENYSFHPLLLQWQECRSAIISNYCARFGKQHLEWVLI
jgi:hypothetical protein